MYVRACMYLICESINASVERKFASFRIRVSSLKLCGIGWDIPSIFSAAMVVDGVTDLLVQPIYGNDRI